jgi:hypothetical protein
MTVSTFETSFSKNAMLVTETSRDVRGRWGRSITVEERRRTGTTAASAAL